MLTFTHVLNFVLMIALPVALGFFLARRFGLAWRLFIVGAVTWILSQVFHIPLNAGLTLAFKQGLLPSPPEAWQLGFNAVVLGLTSGLCEELARYFVLRTALKEARSWTTALMFGAGHGGVEAILFGLIAALGFINLVMIRDNPALLNTLPADQLAIAQAQVTEYWSASWYLTLLGAVERAFSLCVHLSLAVMVMQVFLRRQLRWLVAAIGWHALLNGVAVISVQLGGPIAAEGVVGVGALLSLGIIFALRTPDPLPASEPAPAVEPLSASDIALDPSAALDRSRFEQR